MYDVVVIGAGPAGSRIAQRLAAKGHRVLVLEKHAGVGQKLACTGIVGQECVNTFQIDESVILQKLNSARILGPAGRELRIFRPGTQAVVLDRPAFDRLMAARAQQTGAAYRFNSRVTDAVLGRDRIDVSVAAQGENQVIPARAVVVATGFVPGLNGRLGLGRYKDYTAGAQAVVTAPGLAETEVYSGDVSSGFFGWLVPAGGDAARVGLLARENAGLLLKKWLEELAGRGKIASADVPISYGGIPLKPPERTYGERWIAVGDAAGQVKPTTGGGIFYGLIGADIGAEVLDKALRADDLARANLARYERLWRRRLGKEIRTGYWARRLYERMSNSQIDRLLDIIKAGGIAQALLEAEDISFDWHGRAIMGLLKYRLITQTLRAIGLPKKTPKIDRQRP